MCTCINDINAELGPDHCLNTSFSMKTQAERPIVGLIRRDRWTIESRRGKRSFFACNFCPWCGEKYAEAEIAEGAAA